MITKGDPDPESLYKFHSVHGNFHAKLIIIIHVCNFYKQNKIFLALIKSMIKRDNNFHSCKM